MLGQAQQAPNASFTMPAAGGFNWGAKGIPYLGDLMSGQDQQGPPQTQLQPQIQGAGTGDVQAALNKMGYDQKRAQQLAGLCALAQGNTKQAGATPAPSSVTNPDPAQNSHPRTVRAGSGFSKEARELELMGSLVRSVREKRAHREDTGHSNSSVPPVSPEGPALRSGDLRTHVLATFAKHAAQDNSASQRTTHGDDHGITTKVRPDDYMTGPDAWAETAKYLHGKGSTPHPAGGAEMPTGK